MLRCVRRYRSAKLGLFVEPGEVLRDLSPEAEGYLVRDAPGCWEVVAAGAGLEAPPVDRMVRRERAVRKGSETAPGEVMTRGSQPGLVRQE